MLGAADTQTSIERTEDRTLPNSKTPENNRPAVHEILSQVEEYLITEGRDDLAPLIERARMIVEERLISGLPEIKVVP